MLVRKWPLNDLTGSEPRASILRSDFSLIWIVMVMMMIVVDIVMVILMMVVERHLLSLGVNWFSKSSKIIFWKRDIAALIPTTNHGNQTELMTPASSEKCDFRALSRSSDVFARTFAYLSRRRLLSHQRNCFKIACLA